MYSLSSEEFLSLSRALMQHHAIFDRLWSMGRPVFTEEIPTAAVYFDKVGETIEFKINPEFWKTLDDVQKQFVISHECLHVILYHGIRINQLKSDDIKIANLALDIIVNHSLVDRFGFKREEIDPTNKYCWVDTVFKDSPPEAGKYYEYYYNLLEKNPESTGCSTVDMHDGLSSFNTPEFEDKLKELASPDELESLSDFVESQTKDIEGECQKAGCNPGNTFILADVGNVKHKKKWETVIKKWAAKFIKDDDIEQWARRNRRLTFMPNDFMIPSDQEVEAFEKDRIQVWFFQDTSGSCSGFVNRFFKAAKSLPPERFDIKMHCFDTRVFETTLESKKLYGFGGTSFSCLENYIQSYIKKHGLNYPKAIFVITDGYGDRINPQLPDRWYWFLSTKYTGCIPKECKILSLSDFE